MSILVEPRARFSIIGRSKPLLDGSFWVDDGRCFVCGTTVRSLHNGVWSIQADIDSPEAIRDMFELAASHARVHDDYVKVSVCDEHKVNLSELCRLVYANNGDLTSLIIQHAMDGAWFVEKQITYLVRRRPTHGPSAGCIELVYLDQDGAYRVIGQMSSSHPSIQSRQVMTWVRLMLAQEHNRAIDLPEEGEIDFFPGMEEKLQGILDQQVSTENPK